RVESDDDNHEEREISEGKSEQEKPARQLAIHLAKRIDGWLAPGARPGGEGWLDSEDRPLRAGDIMILSASRQQPIFSLLPSLLKSYGIGVAPRDRVVLSEQPAVRDLLVLGRVLLARDDDLSLAITLKSPLFGFTDADLLALARIRRGGERGERGKFFSLWDVLRGSSESRHQEVVACLRDYGDRVDRRRPYEFYCEILQEGLRERLLADLSADAEEDIERFLNWSLAWEKEGEVAPSLERFLHDLSRDRTEHAGRQDPHPDEVRILTIHGAKGLEAPVVILPQTTRLPKLGRLLWMKDEVAEWPLWLPNRARHPQGLEEKIDVMRKKLNEEDNRLLYVALTRARDRLHVYGVESPYQEKRENWWYTRIRDGFERLEGVEPFEIALPWELAEGDTALRFIHKGGKREADPEKHPDETRSENPRPPWWGTDAPETAIESVESVAPVLSASSLSGEGGESESSGHGVVSTEGGDDRRKALLRGDYIHRLLQFLPGQPSGSREQLARGWLGRVAGDFTSEEQEEMLLSVLRVLDSDFAALCFVPHALSEVGIVGTVEREGKALRINGRIDQLVIDAERVLVVDYKSDRRPPASAREVSLGYLLQMAAYRALLRDIYPGREVEAALLWTSRPLWMPLPSELLDSLISVRGL
ncbi:MAG: PD-(D/E)XK nuclease family protein, partial [Alphaproteobacteria bacterium]